MARTENKSTSSWKRIKKILPMLVFLTLIIAGIVGTCFPPWNVSWAIIFKRNYVENFIEFPLPDEASNIEIDIYTSLHPFIEGTSVKIRFELPPEDLPELLALMCFDGEDLDSNRNPHFVTEYSPEWWTPDKVTSFQAGECWGTEKGQTGYGKEYEILIDQSNSSSYIVYLGVYNLP